MSYNNSLRFLVGNLVSLFHVYEESERARERVRERLDGYIFPEQKISLIVSFSKGYTSAYSVYVDVENFWESRNLENNRSDVFP